MKVLRSLTALGAIIGLSACSWIEGVLVTVVSPEPAEALKMITAAASASGFVADGSGCNVSEETRVTYCTVLPSSDNQRRFMLAAHTYDDKYHVTAARINSSLTKEEARAARMFTEQLVAMGAQVCLRASHGADIPKRVRKALKVNCNDA